MSQEKQYTPEKLDKAVKKYFRSISRCITLTEKKPVILGQDEDGNPVYKEDEMGHIVYTLAPIVNSLGKEMKVLEYIIPPSVGDLAIFLGIHRSTWDRYCQCEEFCDTTTHARGLMHAYLERESLTRSGKDLKGILFNLENNYGYKEKIELEHKTLESWLQENAGEDGGGQAF